MLVVGLALVYVAVHMTKAAIDRPRPAGPLVEHDRLASFPSGHAAYATAWVAVAVALTRARGLPTRRRSSPARSWCSPPRSG